MLARTFGSIKCSVQEVKGGMIEPAQRQDEALCPSPSPVSSSHRPHITSLLVQRSLRPPPSLKSYESSSDDFGS